MATTNTMPPGTQIPQLMQPGTSTPPVIAQNLNRALTPQDTIATTPAQSQSMWQSLSSDIGSMLNDAESALVNVGGAAWNAGRAAIDAIEGDFGSAKQAAQLMAQGAWDQAKELGVEAWDDLVGIGTSLKQSLIDLLNWLDDQAKNVINLFIIGGAIIAGVLVYLADAGRD